MAARDGVSTPVEARHRALLEAIPDLLLRLRGDGTYLGVAGDLSRLANRPEKVIGANVRDLLEPEIAAQLMAGVAEALETGQLATVNYKLRTYGGDECDFELRIAPAGRDEVVVIARDVTDVREAIRELRESRARVVAAGDAARWRIERNLHDAAQQRLVTVALQLNLIAKLPDGRRGPAAEAAAYDVVAEALANAAKHAAAPTLREAACRGSPTGSRRSGAGSRSRAFREPERRSAPRFRLRSASPYACLTSIPRSSGVVLASICREPLRRLSSRTRLPQCGFARFYSSPPPSPSPSPPRLRRQRSSRATRPT